MTWAKKFVEFSVNRSGSAANLFANDVLKIFQDSYVAFTEVCSMNHFDGCWIGPVVDLMTTLLVQFAEEADEANLSNPQAYRNDVLASEQSMQEDAIGKMTGMFRILRSEKE